MDGMDVGIFRARLKKYRVVHLFLMLLYQEEWINPLPQATSIAPAYGKSAHKGALQLLRDGQALLFMESLP
ncbi:hypothetical protein C172_01480 [Paenibacillus sp. FSL H8-457]|nr:hypothetical protein C172_01480 [Paenibacillus sp. FSL H8-457]